MFLAIDVGGTKTLVATFTNSGKLHEQVRFETPKDYAAFLNKLEEVVNNLSVQIFQVAVIAIPGKINRNEGIGIAFGNLSWKNIPVKRDLAKFVDCPILIENDANLAGLSEAINVKDEFKKALYITISTGIGTGIINNGIIDPELADSEPGLMKVQYNDRLQEWEEIASGSAIKKRYGKIAADINDKKIWQEICHRIAIGLNGLIAIVQPEVIIFGGGVGAHFKRYGKILEKELKKYSTPLTPVHPLRPTVHAAQAVIYDCYQVAYQCHEKSN